MGIFLFSRLTRYHPIFKDLKTAKDPEFDTVFLDHNGVVHSSFSEFVTIINEILYYLYFIDRIREKPDSEESKNLLFDEDLIKQKISYYHEKYELGTTYSEMVENLTTIQIAQIVFDLVVEHTKNIFHSLNLDNRHRLYLVFDGIPSKAKYGEQKNRRYCKSLHDKIINEIKQNHKFHRENVHQIDGNVCRLELNVKYGFMENLEKILEEIPVPFHYHVVPSCEDGEGEMKIAEMIASTCQGKRVCIMSGDSDLYILLGMMISSGQIDCETLHTFGVDSDFRLSFYDMNLFVKSFSEYFSKELGTDVSPQNVHDSLFSLFVLGNDFIPAIEPFRADQHFDIICKHSLRLLLNGMPLEENQVINFQYILEFLKLLSNETLEITIDDYLHDTYFNYSKIKKSLTVTQEDIDKQKVVIMAKPYEVTPKNILLNIRLIKNAFADAINMIAGGASVQNIINEMNKKESTARSLLAFPKLVRIMGVFNPPTDAHDFLVEMRRYFLSTRNNRNNVILMADLQLADRPIRNRITADTDFQREMALDSTGKSEKLFGMFQAKNEFLATINIVTEKITHLRDSYYSSRFTNCNDIPSIKTVIINYLSGIQWLYHYYSQGKASNRTGWYYQYRHTPQISDMIRYLISTKTVNTLVAQHLDSFPENKDSFEDHYLQVTPDDITKAGVNPKIDDVIGHLDGVNAYAWWKSQIKWEEI